MAYGKIDPKIETAAREAIATARKDTIGLVDSVRVRLIIHRDQIADLNALTAQHATTLADIHKVLAELHNRVTVLEEGVTPN